MENISFGFFETEITLSLSLVLVYLLEIFFHYSNSCHTKLWTSTFQFQTFHNEDANFSFWCFGFGSMACQVIHKQKESRSPCSFQENESFQGTGTVRIYFFCQNPDFEYFFWIFRFAPKLFRLPSILTSDNAGTWLVTRKNKNDNNTAEEKTTCTVKNDNDNNKWLAQPKVEVKVETDVVTLTGRLTKLRFKK